MQFQCAWQEAVSLNFSNSFLRSRRGFGVFNLPLTLYNLCSAVDLFTPSDYFIGGQSHPHNPRTLTLERYYWHPRSLKPFLSVQISDPSRHQVYSQARSMCPQFYRDAKLWGGASQLQLIYRSTLQYFQLTIPHSQRDTCPLLKFFNCRPSINLWGWNPASKTNAILGNRLWACDICGPIHWDEDKKLIPYITLFSNLWDSIGPSDSLELLLWITPIYLKPCAQDTREQDWFIKSFEEGIRWPCWIMRPISRINLWNFVTKLNWSNLTRKRPLPRTF